MISSDAVRKQESSDSNWNPQSVVLFEVRSNFANYRSIKAWASVSAVMSLINTTSGHRVKRHTIVN